MADSKDKSAQKQDNIVLIKKYPNRRLYNTSTSAYIVLDDLVGLVKSNVTFEIRDTKTNEDITREILNQIIFERETGKKDFHFPLEVQKQLIGMYGDTYGKMMPDYLKQSLEIFSSERARMKSTMENVVEQNTKVMMEVSQSIAKQNMEVFKRSWEMFSAPISSHIKDEKTTKEDKATHNNNDDELQAIQNQIDELQKRLKNLK